MPLRWVRLSPPHLEAYSATLSAWAVGGPRSLLAVSVSDQWALFWKTGGARACRIRLCSFWISAFKKALFLWASLHPQEREAKRKMRMRSHHYCGGADWRCCRCDSSAGAPAPTASEGVVLALGSRPRGRSAGDAGVPWNPVCQECSGSVWSGTEGVPWWNGARAYLILSGWGTCSGAISDW